MEINVKKNAQMVGIHLKEITLVKDVTHLVKHVLNLEHNTVLIVKVNYSYSVKMISVIVFIHVQLVGMKIQEIISVKDVNLHVMTVT